MAVFNNINIFHKTKIQIVILKYSRKQKHVLLFQKSNISWALLNRQTRPACWRF